MQIAAWTLPFASLRVRGADQWVRPYTGLAVSHCWFVGGFEGGVPFVDFVPVHYVPPGG